MLTDVRRTRDIGTFDVLTVSILKGTLCRRRGKKGDVTGEEVGLEVRRV